MLKQMLVKRGVGLLTLFVAGQVTMAQQNNNLAVSEPSFIEAVEGADTSEFVTINVKNANIAEVLKAYSLQTGQSIVVGPDVVSENVNVRLNNIPWKDALDVTLKPYGFGYRVVGDTIVINKLENIVTVESIEPLNSRVFHLGFLDAYDIKSIVEAQLSVRGKFTIHETKSLPGWEFGGNASSGGSGAATEGGIRGRKEKQELQKSKTFVVTDVPSAITQIEGLIKVLDKMPQQVLIEAKFLEISTGGLMDIGLDYINAMENVEESATAGGTGTSSLQPAALDNLLKVLNMTSGYPNSLNTAAAGGYTQDEGIRLSHSVLGDWGADMLFAFAASDDDANVLSAPRILTLNNQEAAILVGEKYPIIDSDSSTVGGGQTQSESLDYYENIGIQLNVIPQVCNSNYINMIVHPAVSKLQDGNVIGNNSYPRIDVREAETQILLKSENTAVIGGLQDERDFERIKKVPFLGDIPFLGRLFRRETTEKEKIDLLIFIKASIIENEAYALLSKEKEQMQEARMDLDLLNEAREEAGADAVIETAQLAAEGDGELLELMDEQDTLEEEISVLSM